MVTTPNVPLADAPARRNAQPMLPAAPAPAARNVDTAAASNVTYRLSIRPWGEIYVDGVRRGISPPMKSLQLLPGDYKIEVRNGSLTPHRLQLQVSADAAAPDVVHAFKSGQP